MFLIQKYTQYKAAQAEQQKRKVTEKELVQLNYKIDKLLNKLDEHEPEIASNRDEECVVCVNAKATMQTYPCGHRVICRKCFVKTIQMAVAQRLLPLRCVICRAKILRLKHMNGDEPASSPTSASSSSSSSASSTTSALRQTIRHWYKVPQSDSLYSVTSNASGGSRASSASSSSTTSSFKTCASTFSAFRKAKMGYELLTSTPSSPPSLKKLLFSKKSSNYSTSTTPVSEQPSPKTTSIDSKISTISSNTISHPPCRSSSCSSQLLQKSMPKKENRIVPVQPPKPLSMGLSTNANTSSLSSPSNSSNSTTSSPSSSSTSTAINPSPLKGKFKLVQEFQREFHIGREKCLTQNQISGAQSSNKGKGSHVHSHSFCNGSSSNLKSGRHLPHPTSCHCRHKSTLQKDTSINSISSCVASIPSSNSTRKGSTTTINSSSNTTTTPTASANAKNAKSGESNDTPNINRKPPPSSQSCPSFKQLKPPQCHSHYHHHRCNCGTDRLRKLEPLIEVR